MAQGTAAMKRFILLIMFCSVVSGQSVDSLYNSLGHEIITGEEIEQSGVARLSDIFSMINPAFINTIDGYHVKTNLGSLSPSWTQDWIIFIDNQRIDLDYPYMKNVNLIPLGVDEISYVETTTTPGLVNGEFASNGVIHIHTKKAPDGFSLNASLASANETGDPGPYKYMDDQLPNIDQIGPYYWASLKYGFESFSARLGLKHHIQIYTDPKINNRLISYPWIYKEMRMLGVSLKLDFKFGGSNHSLFISRTETGDPVLFRGYGSDLLFFDPLGKEIPTEPKFTHAGLSGNFRLSSKVKLNYAFKFSSSLLDWTMPPADNIFDWNINNYDGMIEIAGGENYSGTKIAVGFNHVKLITHYSLVKNNATTFRINGQTSLFNNEQYNQTLFGGVTFNGTSSSIKMGTNLAYKVNKDVGINGILAYSTKLEEENPSFWYWVTQGYNFMSDYNINYSIAAESENSRKLTGDCEFVFQSGNKFFLSLGGFFRRFWDYNLERQEYYYNDDTSELGTNTNLEYSDVGTVAGFKLHFNHKITPALYQQLFYQYIPHFSGSSSFFDSWQSFPQHKVQYSVYYSPYKSFSMYAGFTYLSETYWVEYTGNKNVMYKNIVEGNVILDAAVQKTFWDGRIRLNLMLKNILGGFVVYHPAGELMDMTLYMKVALLFDSIL